MWRKFGRSWAAGAAWRRSERWGRGAYGGSERQSHDAFDQAARHAHMNAPVGIGDRDHNPAIFRVGWNNDPFHSRQGACRHADTLAWFGIGLLIPVFRAVHVRRSSRGVCGTPQLVGRAALAWAGRGPRPTGGSKSSDHPSMYYSDQINYPMQTGVINSPDCEWSQTAAALR